MLGQCQFIIIFLWKHMIYLLKAKWPDLMIWHEMCYQKLSLLLSQFLYYFIMDFLKKLHNFPISQPNCLNLTSLRYSLCYRIIRNSILKLKFAMGIRLKEGGSTFTKGKGYVCGIDLQVYRQRIPSLYW